MKKTIIRTDNYMYALNQLQKRRGMPWHHWPNMPGESVTIEFVHEKWNGQFREHWKITIADKRDDVRKALKRKT